MLDAFRIGLFAGPVYGDGIPLNLQVCHFEAAPGDGNLSVNTTVISLTISVSNTSALHSRLKPDYNAPQFKAGWFCHFQSCDKALFIEKLKGA